MILIQITFKTAIFISNHLCDVIYGLRFRNVTIPNTVTTTHAVQLSPSYYRCSDDRSNPFVCTTVPMTVVVVAIGYLR